MKKVLKRIGIVLLSLLVLLLLVVGGYVVYMQSQYYRIPDHEVLEIETPAAGRLMMDTAYTALTYNVGFGAYGPEYTFFMDTGIMADGTETAGYWARARSKEEMLEHIAGAGETAQAQNTDFILFQEVDTNATRSFYTDQKALLRSYFPGYGQVFALNFHSAYLCYPFYQPHGSVEAGLYTLLKYEAASAERRSYPVDNSFVTKFTDLDRCFSVQRLPVEGGKELVLINSHMSAYDEGGTVRAEQLAMLNGVLAEEREKGNYVVVGGDFNHALYGTAEAFPSGQQRPGWVFELEDKDLAEGFSFVQAENGFAVPTCRGCDIPYEKGVDYTVVVDGFIVSDNITATAENIDTDFAYSDHNPVRLTFILQ
ncbi:MAG: endonuclease/exonuclease/phosphatase family protein [Oscillospiraceae bacterium]|nr:endonuclease/exonuclease/phosphatase family protein [Oscillospiraceae bacterium]